MRPGPIAGARGFARPRAGRDAALVPGAHVPQDGDREDGGQREPGDARCPCGMMIQAASSGPTALPALPPT